MKRALVALALTVCCTPAYAQFYTGNDWLRKYTSKQVHDQIAILGYTAGIADGHPNICIPNGVTLGQMADMVHGALVRVPEHRHHSAAVFVIAVLEPVWPCTQAPAAKARIGV